MSSCSGQVSAAGLPAEGLDLHAEVLGEMNGVKNVPAVQTEALLALVETIGADHLRHAEVRRRVFGVAAAGDVEVPGAAKVVLRAGAADRREIVVAVEVDLELALAPPAGGIDSPGEVGADVVTLTCDAVDENVRIACAKRVVAPELGVKIAQPGDVMISFVGHLVVQLGIVIAEVLYREPGPTLERHRPVGVEAPMRVDGDHGRTDLSEPAPAAGEEVAERDLDSW